MKTTLNQVPFGQKVKSLAGNEYTVVLVDGQLGKWLLADNHCVYGPYGTHILEWPDAPKPLTFGDLAVGDRFTMKHQDITWTKLHMSNTVYMKNCGPAVDENNYVWLILLSDEVTKV
jgi:hypothetical protein